MQKGKVSKMSNYPDGFNMSLLDGPSSLADQVREDAIVIFPDNNTYPTIISYKQDYNNCLEFLEDRIEQKGYKQVAKELQIDNCKNKDDLESTLDQMNENDELDEAVMNAYDGRYGDECIDIDPI